MTENDSNDVIVADEDAQPQARPEGAGETSGATLEESLVRRRRRGPLAVLANPRLAWAVAVLALVLAGVAATAWADLYAADQARGEVRSAATDLVLRLTTFEGAEIEEWLEGAKERATGAYAEQLTALFNQELRDALREREVVSRGDVEQLFIQDIQGDQASVFALVRQTIANSSTPDPVEDELRMDITMQRVDGRWLASDVAILGPSGLVVPPAPDGATPQASEGAVPEPTEAP